MIKAIIIVVFLIGVSLIESLPSEIIRTDDLREIATFLDGRNDTDLDSIYPNNVTGLYKGPWEIIENLNNGTNNMKERIEFGKTRGNEIFSLLTKPSQVKGIDILTGDMWLRDGIYTSDSAVKLVLQGVYFAETGLIFMIGNPYQGGLVKDFSIDISGNSSFLETIFEAEKAALNRSQSAMAEFGPYLSPHQNCYFMFLLQVENVTSSWNFHWKEWFSEETPESESVVESGPNITMKGVIWSSQCGVKLSASAFTIDFSSYITKATNYVVLIIFSSFLEIILLIRQMEYTHTQTGASKVSVFSIGMQTIMDSYLFFVHITAGVIGESLFTTFATAAFLKMIAFFFFGMRYIFIIWKSQRNLMLWEWNAQARREVGMLYARFYGMIILIVMSMYYMGGITEVFVFLMYSYLVPQIVTNAMRDTNNAMTPQYIVGTALCRFLLPAYFYGCPNNFISNETQPRLVLYLFTWIFIQISLLFLQDFLGPRFFIPKAVLPPRYDYKRPISLEEGTDAECVICMNTIHLGSDDWMHTPCNHIFHSGCLTQWLEHKMACPTCRGALPPV
eukprot:TRINITY_DN6405_c3_g1_i1.p1 TRINITY_DN6405_c3_g1~~TRINITY_DN6405_c3_g1_i1.p1  ORF type:complete len:561 (-),score=114.99 TRINITY_DN6405_c3_g1_i1:20-1702(-)